MEPQSAFNVVIGALNLCAGWLLKMLYDATRDLKAADGEIHERINGLPDIYMRRDDFGAFAVRIETTLGRIEAKLDAKADK